MPYSPTEFLDDPTDLEPGYSTEEIAVKYNIKNEPYSVKNEAAFAKSLGTLTEDKLAGAKKVLDTSSGFNVPVFIGRETGEFEFINPETGNRQLVNPTKFGLEDITGVSGDAMVLIPDAVGALVGGLLYSNPVTAGFTTGLIGAVEPEGLGTKVLGAGGGAVGAFAAVLWLGNPYYGIVAGALCGALMASIFCLFTINLMTNQVATGLGLTIFAIGLTGLAGAPLIGKTIPSLPKIEIF